MVDVRGSFCIDRFESTLVDKKTGNKLSPYYHPSPEVTRREYERWQRARADAKTDEGRRYEVPPPDEWELAAVRFEPVAQVETDVTPNGYMSAEAAQRACENAGKRLCSDEEWVTACRGEHNTKFPHHQIQFNQLLGKASSVQQLKKLVHEAIQAAVKRATTPQVKVDDSDLDTKYNVVTTTTTPHQPKTPKVPQPLTISTPTQPVPIVIGAATYTPPPQQIVDPYAGLNPRAKVHAQHLLTHGLGGQMSGTTDWTLTQSDVNDLRNWVVSQTTTGGNQKWVVNVGPGTGLHSHRNQFKVSGFGVVSGSTKAPTYHITINQGLV